MLIETYILCNNEELLMPYLMRHYKQFSKVFILESNSTDKTVDIARSMGGEVWKYDVPDEINDRWFKELKNTCWKDSQAAWVIVVDADEFVYHPNIERILKYCQSTVICPRFFNMYSETFPTTKGQIYEEVKSGVEQIAPKAKMNIFRPHIIRSMNYLEGCHEAFPIGKVVINYDTGIKTLHMRNLGREFVINRNLRARQRNSKFNKEMGWGVHVEWSQEEWMHIFDEGINQATKII
jgi:glycosyltransferase involved in cell wall biosynthesis